MSSLGAFLEARDFLQAHRSDYETAYREFRWPKLDQFNWALDYFDALAQGNFNTALHLVDEDGDEERNVRVLQSLVDTSEPRSARRGN